MSYIVGDDGLMYYEDEEGNLSNGGYFHVSGSDASADVGSHGAPEDLSSAEADASVDVSSGDADREVTDVSSGDLLLDLLSQYDFSLLAAGDIQDDAQYLSAAIVEVFDRVVSGSDYQHYIAFRNGDNYSAKLLLFNSYTLSGNVLTIPEGQLVTYYRTAYTSGYQTTYTYNYSVRDFSNEYFNPASDVLFYTDVYSGYPVLGIEPITQNFSPVFLFVGFIILVVLILFRGNK